MEKILKDLKLIYDDERVIGKVEDIIEAFYRLIKYDIDNVENLEEKAIAITEKVDLIVKLTNEIGDNELRKNAILEIKQNPMGGFDYEVV